MSLNSGPFGFAWRGATKRSAMVLNQECMSVVVVLPHLACEATKAECEETLTQCKIYFKADTEMAIALWHLPIGLNTSFFSWTQNLMAALCSSTSRIMISDVMTKRTVRITVPSLPLLGGNRAAAHLVDETPPLQIHHWLHPKAMYSSHWTCKLRLYFRVLILCTPFI